MCQLLFVTQLVLSLVSSHCCNFSFFSPIYRCPLVLFQLHHVLILIPYNIYMTRLDQLCYPRACSDCTLLYFDTIHVILKKFEQYNKKQKYKKKINVSYNHRKKKRIPVFGYFRVFKEYPQKSQTQKERDKSQLGNVVGNSLIGICLTLPNLGFAGIL